MVSPFSMIGLKDHLNLGTLKLIKCVGLSSSLLAALGCGQSPEEEWLVAQSVNTELVSDFDEEVIASVNAVRATGYQCGDTLLTPTYELRIDEYLQVSAKEHADDMVSNRTARAITSDGRTELKRAIDAGANPEHLEQATSAYGWDHTDADTLLLDALGDETTCRKILDPGFTHIGFSLRTEIDDDQAYIFWSLVLGGYNTIDHGEPEGPRNLH